MGTTRYNHPELGMAHTKTNVVGFGLVCFGLFVCFWNTSGSQEISKE